MDPHGLRTGFVQSCELDGVSRPPPCFRASICLLGAVPVGRQPSLVPLETTSLRLSEEAGLMSSPRFSRVALSAQKVPSVVDLAVSFASLKSGKAAGLSGLPAEVFKSFPMGAALAYFPLLAKTVAWGMQPVHFTGGLAHVIPKGEKAPGELTSWRSIMRLESDAKAIQRAFRPALMESFMAARATGQYGGIPGCQLSLPSFLVRGHLLFLQARNLWGGVLFIDCKSAYYSVVREFILTTEPAGRTAYLEDLSRKLFAASEARAHFVKTLASSDIFASLGTSTNCVSTSRRNSNGRGSSQLEEVQTHGLRPAVLPQARRSLMSSSG